MFFDFDIFSTQHQFLAVAAECFSAGAILFFALRISLLHSACGGREQRFFWTGFIVARGEGVAVGLEVPCSAYFFALPLTFGCVKVVAI